MMRTLFPREQKRGKYKRPDILVPSFKRLRTMQQYEINVRPPSNHQNKCILPQTDTSLAFLTTLRTSKPPLSTEKRHLAKSSD